MKKIVVNFNSAHKIQKIKSIMKKVHSKGHDQTKDILKFALGKSLVPNMIERAEIQLIDKYGGEETVDLAKESLTFLHGSKPPFDIIDSSSDEDREYLILPWNVGSFEGRKDLEILISKMTSKIKTLKYTIYVNIAQNVASNQLSTYAPNLSTMSFGGQIDELLEQIEDLEQSLIKSEGIIAETKLVITQKDELIHRLESDVSRLNSDHMRELNRANSLNSQVSSLNNQLSGKNSELSNIKSQMVQKDSSINNLTYQVNSLNKTPTINLNVGGTNVQENKTSGSVAFDDIQISFNFNNRTLNIFKQSNAIVSF